MDRGKPLWDVTLKASSGTHFVFGFMHFPPHGIAVEISKITRRLLWGRR